MTKDFLITGCGRSGTAWAARLFTDLGYPCTHERRFNLAHTGPLTGGESSWLAIPHLNSINKSTPILRIMRDPYKVVQSIILRGFLADLDEPYAKYAVRHCPVIERGRDHLGRAIRYTTLWDRPLDRLSPGMLICEDPATGLAESVRQATGNAPDLGEVIRVTRRIGKRTNTNHAQQRKIPPTWEDIEAHPDGALIQRRAEWYGYTREKS